MPVGVDPKDPGVVTVSWERLGDGAMPPGERDREVFTDIDWDALPT